MLDGNDSKQLISRRRIQNGDSPVAKSAGDALSISAQTDSRRLQAVTHDTDALHMLQGRQRIGRPAQPRDVMPFPTAKVCLATFEMFFRRRDVSRLPFPPSQQDVVVIIRFLFSLDR